MSMPVIALAASVTKVTNGGPVLYKAERLGLNGTPFTMYKLRSMHVNAATSGAITGARDARVFPWGAILRRFKIDELPQLLNVLCGDMSLVGPRPEDPNIIRTHYSSTMLESLNVRPGITGPGSLDYFAAEDLIPKEPGEAADFYVRELLPRKVALDMVYVQHQTVGYHLELIIRTLLQIVGLRALYSERRHWELDRASQLTVKQFVSTTEKLTHG